MNTRCCMTMRVVCIMVWLRAVDFCVLALALQLTSLQVWQVQIWWLMELWDQNNIYAWSGNVLELNMQKQLTCQFSHGADSNGENDCEQGESETSDSDEMDDGGEQQSSTYDAS